MNNIRSLSVIIHTLFLFSLLNAQDITGDWYGKTFTADSTRFNLHVSRDKNRLKATYDNPDDAWFNRQIDEFIIIGDTVFFTANDKNITYKGNVNRDFSKIYGELTLYGHKEKLDFGRKKLMRIIPVNESAMVQKPAKVRAVKTSPAKKLPYTGIRVVKARPPKIINIDPSQLKVLTPGKNGIPNPRVIPLEEFSVTSEYPYDETDVRLIHDNVRAKQSKPVTVQPMRIKDAASFNIQWLDSEQGLLDSRIYSLMEDSRGNIWLGSNYSGVCRYDGQYLTYYTQVNGLTSNLVWSMIEDRKGNIWMATGWGLCIYDGTYFNRYTSGLLNGVQSLLESKNGNIWIGTRNAGVLEKKEDTWLHYSEREGLINNTVTAIDEDDFGNIWFGTDKGVCKYDGMSFTHYTEKEGLISDKVTSVIKDRYGNLWIGTNLGINKYDGKSFSQYNHDQGVRCISITSIREDHDGCLWFATTGGVDLYDGKSFMHFTVREGLNDSDLKSIIEDKDNNIWMGTKNSGVMKLQKNSFIDLKDFDNFDNAEVTSIVEDHEGNILFGFLNGTLIKYDGNSYLRLLFDEDRNTVSIQSMLEDKDGNIWFTGYGHLLGRYNGKSITFFENQELWDEGTTMYLYEDDEGNIWLGTWGGGLKRFYKGYFTDYLPFINRPKNLVSAILQDHGKNIWFTDNSIGLFKYDGEYILQYNCNEGLSDNRPTSLLEDKRGNIWIGTEEGGINKYDGHSFTSYTEKEGLCNNYVTSVIEDNKGYIWVGTKRGLSMLYMKEDSNYSVISFGMDDGIKDLAFNRNCVCIDSHNRLWWGAGHKIIVLDMNTFDISPEPPEIQLNNILLNQEYIDFGDFLSVVHSKDKKFYDATPGINLRRIKFSDVTPFYNYPLGLVLPHNLNHLTFSFTAIDWTAPQSIRYQYILEGQDDQWSALSKENLADYRNIPPGKYRFRVKALNRAGVWSETLEYPFTVRHPWWFRWWTCTIYALLLLLLARYYIRYLVSRERIRAEVEIKRVEVEKMQELDRMKSRFFANISHEFRTPLTLILGPIEDLFTRKPEHAELSWEILKVIRRNAMRLQKLINQLLDISRLETGEVKLQVHEGDLEEYIRTIIMSFLSLAESKNIKYEYELPETSAEVFFDSDKLEKILTNLIHNAFKFTPAHGKIMVSFQYLVSGDSGTPGFAEIKVSDTGRGIPREKIDRIFDRFYQVSEGDTRDAEGTGIGLALTRELVELYRGEIKVESEVNKGSVFTLILPVSKELFKENEITEVHPGDKVMKKVAGTDVMEEEPAEIETGEGEISEGYVEETAKEQQVVLIVEDNIDLRNYISRNLGDGYRIMMAENGKAGLESAIENIPDLVISDLMMPVMDGMEMCRLLKKDERTNHIPIIMLTARADRGSKLEGLETGADDYIIKPFDAEELKVRVRNLIEQRKKLREIFSSQFLEQEQDITAERFEDKWIRKLFDNIDQHYSDFDLRMDELGRELHLSRAQFFRKVHALTGNTPNELLRMYRIKKAVTLIKAGEDNITRVMYEVGFRSTSHFALSFRKYYGMNPSEYRDSLYG